MKSLSNTEAELKKGVAYKNSVYFDISCELFGVKRSMRPFCLTNTS